MNKKELADASGVLDHDAIRKIVRGKRSPYASDFLKLHSVLRCSMRDMVDLDVEYRETIEVIYLGGTRLSYRPLREYLASYGLTPYKALRAVLQNETLSKITKDEDINMRTIAVICRHLRIPPDKVMRLE